MSRRKKPKQSWNQRILWFLSLFMAASMILGLIVVGLPGRPFPTPTPFPTFTPRPRPTWTPSPTVSPPAPPPAGTATVAPLGPQPTITATQTITYSVPLGPAATATEPPATEPPAPLPTEPEPTEAPAAAASPGGEVRPFVFAVAGDSRGNPAVYTRVLEAVAASGSEFLVHTGDLVNSGTEEQWQGFTEVMEGFALPFYPVPGNHDGLDGQLDGYLAHSGAPAAHYSFDRGTVHMTLADSHNGGISAAELEWLRQDLAASEQPIEMVVLHHPPFDPDGTDHIMAYGNDSFHELMVEQDVDYVFTGHIHAYAQAERDGVVYTITGGAGAPLYAADHPQAFHHCLLVTVAGEQVTIEVVRV